MTGPDSVTAMLDKYLDGVLSSSERAEFERLLAERPDLQREVVAQRRIDARLRPMFTAPPAPESLFAGPSRRPAYWRRTLGLAACVALFIGASWGAWALWFSPLAGRASSPFADAARRLYVRETRAGFEPRWECKDDAQFMEFTRDRLGAALLVQAQPGVTLLGWGYEPGLIGPLTATLYALVDGERVLIVMDRADQDPAGAEGSAGDFHIFRRELAGVALYEVSRSGSPRLLDRFIVPDPAIVPPKRAEPSLDNL